MDIRPLLLTLVLTSTGVMAQTPSALSSDERTLSLLELRMCAMNWTRENDDGVSDATTIAKAAYEACHAVVNNVIVKLGTISMAAKLDVIKSMQETSVGDVLYVRKKKRLGG